jgi:hypothetical protein
MKIVFLNLIKRLGHEINFDFCFCKHRTVLLRLHFAFSLLCFEAILMMMMKKESLQVKWPTSQLLGVLGRKQTQAIRRML